MFVALFCCMRTAAQQVFIPTPPVVYIPQLDPVRMHIMNQVNQATLNAAMGSDVAPRSAAKKSAPVKKAASPDDVTFFNPRQENYLPKPMAQAIRASAERQNEAERFYNALVAMYEKTAEIHDYPANDVAFAYLYFISSSYEIYHDLTNLPADKDPRLKGAKNAAERAALLKQKAALRVTAAQDKAIYLQMKARLSGKPSFRKMIDADKQKLTETLAIRFGLLYDAYMRAVQNEDANAIKEAHEMAKEGLEDALGIPIEQVKITDKGVTIN